MADYDYGMDSDLRRKRESSYDAKLEKDIRNWIKSVTGTAITSPGQDGFLDDLHNGVILCELANKLKPGSVKKINKMKMPFMMMENIGAFLTAARALGVPQPDLFMTVDLFEKKNPNQVLQTLVSLGRAAQKVPGYSGPTLGAKLADQRKVDFSEEKIAQGRAVGSLQTTGYTGGASQQGMLFGNRREIGGRER